LCSYFGCIAVREEVSINLFELLDAEVSAGTVLEEPFVPLLDLCVGELGVLPEVFEHLRLQFAVLLAHDPQSHTVLTQPAPGKKTNALFTFKFVTVSLVLGFLVLR
jgi:hypothetical protein